MIKILQPFSVLGKKKALTAGWIICVIIFGQAGIVISLLVQGIKEGAVTNWVLGNYYTFAIALLGSGLFDFFKEYYCEKDIRFRSLKLVTVLLAVLLMLVMASMVAVQQISSMKQLWLYLLSVILGLYTFSIGLLKDDYDDYQHLDDQRTKDLGKRAERAPAQDDRGVSL